MRRPSDYDHCSCGAMKAKHAQLCRSCFDRDRLFGTQRRDRFLAHTRRATSGCLIWTGSLTPKGYGQFGAYRAHRVSYELFVGPIAPGLHVCHHCDVPPCVEPTHLFVATNAENRADSVRKGRTSRRPLPPNRQPRGSANGAARLTEDQVRTIRDWAANGLSQRSIAHQVGVSQTTISTIVRRETWAHVD